MILCDRSIVGLTSPGESGELLPLNGYHILTSSVFDPLLATTFWVYDFSLFETANYFFAVFPHETKQFGALSRVETLRFAEKLKNVNLQFRKVKII